MYENTDSEVPSDVFAAADVLRGVRGFLIAAADEDLDSTYSAAYFGTMKMDSTVFKINSKTNKRDYLKKQVNTVV